MRASALFRLLGDVRRGDIRQRRLRRNALRNRFAVVTLVRTRGRCRRGNNEDYAAETATLLDYCAGTRSRRSRMKTATGRTSEATVPRRHWVGLFRACLRLSPRVVISAEQITEVAQLTRARARFLRRWWRLVCARGRFRQSENKSRAAWMTWPLNHIAATDLRAEFHGPRT